MRQVVLNHAVVCQRACGKQKHSTLQAVQACVVLTSLLVCGCPQTGVDARDDRAANRGRQAPRHELAAHHRQNGHMYTLSSRHQIPLGTPASIPRASRRSTLKQKLV